MHRSLTLALALAACLLALGASAAQADSAHRLFAFKPQTPVVSSSVARTDFVPADSQWSAWLRASRTAEPSATVRVESPTMCLGGVAGCSGGPAQSLGGFALYASSRDSFYFELGHIFDWSILTNGDRGFLARMWGVARWHWWDSEAGISAGAADGAGVEDGLEGMFATLYQACAWGQDTTLTSYGSMVPAALKVDVPSIYTGKFDTCAYIRRIASSTSSQGR
jgi:hypothetical protein